MNGCVKRSYKVGLLLLLLFSEKKSQGSDKELGSIIFNQFLPTVSTFAVRETSVSRTANVGTVGMNGLKIGKPFSYERTF